LNVAFKTLGCKLNYSETSSISRDFENKGYNKVSFKENAEKVIQKLDVLENELVQTKNETPSDRLRFPVMLRDRIEGLISVVAVAEAAPPQQAHEVFQHLKGLLAEKTSSMQQLLSVDLLTLKELAQKANIEFFEE